MSETRAGPGGPELQAGVRIVADLSGKGNATPEAVVLEADETGRPTKLLTGIPAAFEAAPVLAPDAPEGARPVMTRALLVDPGTVVEAPGSLKMPAKVRGLSTLVRQRQDTGEGADAPLSHILRIVEKRLAFLADDPDEDGGGGWLAFLGPGGALTRFADVLAPMINPEAARAAAESEEGLGTDEEAEAAGAPRAGIRTDALFGVPSGASAAGFPIRFEIVGKAEDFDGRVSRGWLAVSPEGDWCPETPIPDEIPEETPPGDPPGGGGGKDGRDGKDAPKGDPGKDGKDGKDGAPGGGGLGEKNGKRSPAPVDEDGNPLGTDEENPAVDDDGDPLGTDEEELPPCYEEPTLGVPEGGFYGSDGAGVNVYAVPGGKVYPAGPGTAAARAHPKAGRSKIQPPPLPGFDPEGDQRQRRGGGVYAPGAPEVPGGGIRRFEAQDFVPDFHTTWDALTSIMRKTNQIIAFVAERLPGAPHAVRHGGLYLPVQDLGKTRLEEFHPGTMLMGSLAHDRTTRSREKVPTPHILMRSATGKRVLAPISPDRAASRTLGTGERGADVEIRFATGYPEHRSRGVRGDPQPKIKWNGREKIFEVERADLRVEALVVGAEDGSESKVETTATTGAVTIKSTPAGGSEITRTLPPRTGIVTLGDGSTSSGEIPEGNADGDLTGSGLLTSNVARLSGTTTDFASATWVRLNKEAHYVDTLSLSNGGATNWDGAVDGRILFVSAGSLTTTHTITLPNPADLAGRVLTIKIIAVAGSGTLDLDSEGGANVEGVATYSADATARTTLRLATDGSNWWLT